MRRFLIIILFCCTSTLAHAGVLVLGDSLSAEYGLEENKGWVKLLREKIASECHEHMPVINASTSGDRTENGVAKLPGLLEHYHPKTVLIELGGNDALRGSPIEAITQQLNTLVQIGQKGHATVLLFEMMIPPNYGLPYTEAFNKMYHQVAKRNNVTLVPFLLNRVGDQEELMQQDGIHPSAEAQTIILENIWPSVNRALHCSKN